MVPSYPHATVGKEKNLMNKITNIYVSLLLQKKNKNHFLCWNHYSHFAGTHDDWMGYKNYNNAKGNK
jgi:hypothetical protein